MSTINLERKIDYPAFECAVLQTAHEMGWTSRVEDKFRTQFKIYRSGCAKDVLVYRHTKIELRGDKNGDTNNKFYITLSKKGPVESFCIWFDSIYAGRILPEEKTEIINYFNILSRNLKCKLG